MTLVEVVVSSAILSVILLGLGSTLMVASRAIPGGAANAVLQSSEAAGRICSELPYAIAVNQRTPHAIEFTVADRNSDAVNETIRYEWSGTAGQPLTRRYNGGPSLNLLDKVTAFDLTYHLDTVNSEIPQSSEGSEVLLKSFQSIVTAKEYSVQSGHWYGQSFKLSLPADTVSWRLTRVQFYARIAGSYNTGSCRVQIQSATAAGLPSGVVLAEKTLWESSLYSWYLMQDFTFDVAGLAPGQWVCLVFRWSVGTEACGILGDGSLGTPATNSTLLHSTTQGASWSATTGESFWYAVYGRVTSPSEPLTEQVLYLSAVDVGLQAADAPSPRAITGLRVLNKPQVLP
jgi:hypothetical protein